MFGTDYFKIVHGGDAPADVGELTPTGFTDHLEVGTAMSRDSNYPDTHSRVVGLADRIEGVLVKKVTTDGPTFEKMTLGYPDLEAKEGQKVTLRPLPPGSIIEVEGGPADDYDDDSLGHLVTNGTGAVTSSTTFNSAMSLRGGRWRVAQSSDRVNGLYKGNLTPEASSSNIRCRIQIIDGGIKA